jgi:hypothetical protein
MVLNQLRDQSFLSGKIGVLVADGPTGLDATHRAIITGEINVTCETRNSVIVIPKVGAIGGAEKLVAKACISVTIFSKATGQVEAMVKAEAKADRQLVGDWAVTAQRIAAGQSASKSVAEGELVSKAIADAVGQLVCQLPCSSFIFPAQVPVPVRTIVSPDSRESGGSRYVRPGSAIKIPNIYVGENNKTAAM